MDQKVEMSTPFRTYWVPNSKQIGSSVEAQWCGEHDGVRESSTVNETTAQRQVLCISSETLLNGVAQKPLSFFGFFGFFSLMRRHEASEDNEKKLGR